MQYQYRQYEATVTSIRRGLENRKKYESQPSRFDKTGFGINLHHRFTSAKIPAFTIDTWVGEYGSLSCSIYFSPANAEIFEAYFLKAINLSLPALLEAAAELIERDSGQAKAKEVAELEARLAQLKSTESTPTPFQ